MPLYGYDTFHSLSPFSNEFKEKLDEMHNELKRLNEVSEAVEEFLPFFQRDYQGEGGATGFDAVITGHDPILIGPNRWRYNFDEITYASSEGEHDNTTDGRTGLAVNAREVWHTAAVAFGVNLTTTENGGTYPNGYSPKAIGGAYAVPDPAIHIYNVPVRMYETALADETTLYYFYAMGTHDGPCT